MFIKYSHLLKSDSNYVNNLIFIVFGKYIIILKKRVSIFNYVMYIVRIGLPT